MDNIQTVTAGKIVTIIFMGGSKKPHHISIKNGRVHKKEGVVCISPQSPLAKALINHKEGEKIRFNSPEGILEVKITQISDF